MSEIDWSKAPEGATHYLPSNAEHGYQAMWYMHNGIHWYAIAADGTEPRYWMIDDYELDIFVPMLIQRPSAWSGDGLPPVGTVCEDDAGNEVVIVAHHVNGVHAIFAESLEAGLLYYGSAGEFRPIRTPEQIAAEEREKALDAMVNCSPLLDKGWSRKVCEALYDNGYRKVEP